MWAGKKIFTRNVKFPRIEEKKTINRFCILVDLDMFRTSTSDLLKIKAAFLFKTVPKAVIVCTLKRYVLLIALLWPCSLSISTFPILSSYIQ